MNFTRALLRLPGEDFAHGITEAGLGAPDYGIMLEQHAAYASALRSLGVETLVLEALPGCPDAYFVEDAAVVIPEAAVITRPGALARRSETASLAAALESFRPLEYIQAPGTLDGGDVMMAGRHFFIGISGRTNREGVEQLGRILEKYGYCWTPVPAEPGRLHLKSSASFLGEQRFLVSPELAHCPEFYEYEIIERDPTEKYAANVILVNGTVLMPSDCPGTRQRLEDLGLPVLPVEASQARKMDGGLSCMSLRF
jgi:dimethylargininase